jgi:5-methylthioadenosine/S-adenosylhomocysteine deaminase
MNRRLVFPGKIVTANRANEILSGSAVEIIDGRINRIAPIGDFNPDRYPGEIIDYGSCVMIPGFIQTHLHLCQTLFRGFADDLELLEWLRKRIFLYENSHTPESLRASVRLGIHDLLSGGTTTILDMGTLRHQEVVFQEMISSGIRAFAGNCMMDRNELFPPFMESTEWNISESYRLAKEFHNTNGGRLKYGFAPRFVLSCSEKLLREAKAMANDFEGSLFHTHSSENINEVERVRKMTGKENIEYFESIGVLDSGTVLAHCIHLNEYEINSLRRNNAKVSHCPSSNLKLGSGIANIPRYINEGISVSLGADGAPCNNSLSAFNEMRLAAQIQKPFHRPTVMDARTVFRLATIGGAVALGIENETGSIEPGKKGDLVLLDLEKADQPLQLNDEQIYSAIVYSCTKENVKDVFVEGEMKVKDGVALLYDEKEIISEGKKELRALIGRT